MPWRNGSVLFLWFMFQLIIHSSPIMAASDDLSGDVPTEFISKICALKYYPDDLSMFARVNLDESQWCPLPVDSSMNTLLLDIPKGMGCFRLHLLMAQPHPSKPVGIAVKPLGNAYEIFFNGQKIGARGIVGDRFVEAPRTNALFLIPSKAVKPNAKNLIALRVMETTFNKLHVKDAFQVGFYDALLIQSIKQDYRLEITEWVFSTFIALFLITSFFLNFGDRSNGEYIAFTCFVLIYLIVDILDSHIVYELGLKTPFIQQMLFLFCTFLGISGIAFLICIYDEPFSLWIKLLFISYLGYGFLLMLPLPFTLYRPLLMNGTVLIVSGTAFAGFYLAMKAVFKRRSESIPVLVGISGLAVGTSLGYTDYSDMDRIQPFLYHDLGIAFFLLTVACALMFRYNRIRREVRLFSGKILTAYETERKRLSRDIHDGLGQTLLALKLQLQIMSSDASCVDAAQFTPLIGEVSKAIKELRQISMDLRPAFIENRTIVRLLEYHAALFSQKTGIDVQVTGDNAIDPCVDIKDNLYRIYQESLTNVEKHAQADRVRISLEIRGKRLVMSVTDNGKHFGENADVRKSTGVGMASMKERAHLMGGQFRVRKTSTRGCKIIVEVPFK